MKTKGYLMVCKNGSVRFVKKTAAVGPDEVAVYLEINIPDSVFKPVLQAKIQVNVEDIRPLVIETGVLERVGEALTEEIGLNIRICNIEADKDKEQKS